MASGTNSGQNDFTCNGGTDYSYKNKKGKPPLVSWPDTCYQAASTTRKPITNTTVCPVTSQVIDKSSSLHNHTVTSTLTAPRKCFFLVQLQNLRMLRHSYMTKETNTQGVGYWRESSKGGRDFEFHNFHGRFLSDYRSKVVSGSEFTQSGDHQHCSEPGDCYGKWGHNSPDFVRAC